ncbi:hypothetical protein L1887_32163 [Cichorium endivia]|nr:hypothetical protein L1887_32163 [Cichorium endivia]
MRKIIGSGSGTNRRLDKWGALREQFLSLYKLEKSKNCLLSERITDNRFVWDRHTNHAPHGLVNELDRLKDTISSVVLNDSWTSGDATINGKIPFASALWHKGIRLDRLNCTHCNLEIEDADHVLINCLQAIKVRSEIFKSCGVSNSQISSVAKLIGVADSRGIHSRVGSRLRITCIGMLWWLWKCRND